jgi:alanine racemase
MKLHSGYIYFFVFISQFFLFSCKKNVKTETPVILLGKEKDDAISAETLASLIGTINYEITTRIASHVPRITVE